MDLLDLQNLTQEERTIILNVLRRDDDLRRNQENRISQIKQEIHNLRRNSVLRSGDDLSKICARCKSAFGLVTKTGEICPVCRFRVCRNCRDTLLTGGWLCSLCFKENQLLWLTGEWMTKGKEKFPKSRYSSGTELLRASLRVKRPNGSLAGAEERAGHNNASRTGQNNHYSADSADKKPLSNLLGSFRSGLGASSDGHADGRVAGAVGGGGGVGAGAGMVVQHVSCRRRHDSNSSSNSDSDSQVMGNSKKIHSGTNSAARASSRGESGARREYSAHSLDSRSGENDARIKKSQSHSQRSETSGNTIKEKSLVVGKARDDTERPVEASSRVSNKTRKSELPQSVRGADSRQRKDGVVTRQSTKQSTSDGERPSSGCSFTSSEWGEVTPTESAPSNSAPRDRKEEVGSALGQSSGYVSSSRKSLDVTDSSQQLNQDSPSPSKSKSSPSKLPVRQNSKDSYHDVSRAGVQRQASTGNSQIEPQPHNRHNKTHAVQSHVRRQSSGRSETLSTCSANTASPGTKMRLLDLASNRALERDGEDSVKSWSGGSEDTMSLGMSCSGIPASADTPVFQKVHHRHQKVSHETDGRHTPAINQSRQSDGDYTGASDVSDHGRGSPAPRSQSTTPQRSSHLSIPSVVTTSNAGSHDERSMEDDDDDNIDELVAKYQSSSRLGISRNSIGDSRESLASVYSDAGEINYGRIPVTGEITFGLEYDHKLSALKINIKGCHDIAPVDTKHNRSDPYVKVYLLPDKTRSGKRKSKIKKHTLNPVFNETLSYNISQGELENRTLWVAVWHSDRFGRNDFLGEVIIPMDMYRFDDPTPCTYTLQARLPDTMNEEAMQYKGDLIVSLKYVTPNQIAAEKKPKSKSKKSKQAADSQGELHVMIKSAKNLTAARSNGTSDPFVKGYLLPDRGRTGKQKTSVVKNSVNPTWNHILTFNGVDAMELGDRSLELTVWDHEKLGTNEFLGGARLNLGHGFVKGELQVDWMDARGQESVAWQNMMAQPNTWIDAKLPLRASMGKATAKK